MSLGKISTHKKKDEICEVIWLGMIGRLEYWLEEWWIARIQ